MNWKTITNDRAPIGEPILLRESQSFNDNVFYYAGMLFHDADGGFRLRDYNGNEIRLRSDFKYHCIEAKEIKF